MSKYCDWCSGKIPQELKLCSGCLLISHQFIGTDIRILLSEEKRKKVNNYLKPGRGLTNEQRIKHLTQEINLSIPIPKIFRSSRKDKTADLFYNSEEWGQLVEYFRRFQSLREGEYYFPDGSELSIQRNGEMFINAFRIRKKLPILDIAEWLSNSSRINEINDWNEFILLLDCIITDIPHITNQEHWVNWIQSWSWRGLDSPFEDVQNRFVFNDIRIPPFLEYIQKKYTKENDDRESFEAIRENIVTMEDESYGLIGKSWAKIYYENNDFAELYHKRTFPNLVTENYRLKFFVIDGGKPATYPIGNDPRDWRTLMTWSLFPPGSEGLELMEGLLMNWIDEDELWMPSKRQIKSARLLHDEIEKLGDNSSLKPVNYGDWDTGLLVVGSSGTNYVISPWDMKLKIDAIPAIKYKNTAAEVGIDICIDPLLHPGEVPFGDIAVGYLLALRNDEISRKQIFTLDLFLDSIKSNEELVNDNKYWDIIGSDYESKIESIHVDWGEVMDEETENRIAEYELEQDMKRQEEEYENQKLIDHESQLENDKMQVEIDELENQVQVFLENLNQFNNGDYL